MKAISVRLDDQLGKQFDELCQKSGYKKNTVVTRLIEFFVKNQQKKATLEKKKIKDPFHQVIGLMQMEPLLHEIDDLDKVVYDL
jgi:hypothetical protein